MHSSLYISERARLQRGFTLVELMIVVAIIGVLAALAIFGVTKYLASAKSAEAKSNVGAIARSAVDQYTREHDEAKVLGLGGTSSAVIHVLCASAAPVPDVIAKVKGVKYQPKNDPSTDFGLGSRSSGWPCLGFEISTPIYYRYQYLVGGGYVTSGMVGAPAAGADGFEASAQGDLDGDGALSTFAMMGKIAGSGITVSSQVYVNDDTE